MAIDTQSHPPAQSDKAQLDATAALGILDSLGLGLLVVDPDCTVRYRNAVAADRLPAGDNLDTVFSSTRFVQPFDGWPKEIGRVIKTGASVQLVCVRPGLDEALPTSATVRCTPLNMESCGLGPGVVILVEEETDRAMLEQRLEVTQRLVSLGKLATRVAHELNNPLDGILRYVNLAIRAAGDSREPKLQTYLAESRTGLMRMVQIIGDLLQFSRATDGEFDKANVNEVVEQAIRATAPAADTNRVVVAADLQTQNMPSIRGSRLYQVLCNLIRNAIDAMPDGGRLTITAALVGEEIVLEVADTGVGLPEDVDRLFEPFFTTKEAGKGTGLGLAICRDFIEDMNGTIAASPGEESGAVFTVRIPAPYRHDSSARAPSPPGTDCHSSDA